MKLLKTLRSLSMICFVALLFSSCSKVLDKKPVTQIITPDENSGSITASQAEDLVSGLYTSERGYDFMTWTVFDKIINGDAISDNAYAGGDNFDNITLDNFATTALNGNLNRDWEQAYGMIGRINIGLPQIEKCTDPALSASRKNEMMGEARFLRAFNYFDLTQLFGKLPIVLAPPVLTDAETLLNSTFVARSSVDSVYLTILNDLWFAKSNVMDIANASSKLIITKGVVHATLAKVYATMPVPNWDSVSYYADLVIPNYTMLSDYSFLWDNAHKSNSEAIWEFIYEGYGGPDGIGNWIPSIHFEGKAPNISGGTWKKFNLPANSLVNLFESEGDNVRLENSITFLDVSGQFGDPNWPSNHYPFLTKYNDGSDGLNDFYVIRLPDIMLLKAEALVKAGNLTDALGIVTAIRARVGLGPKSGSTADEVDQIIADERRMELAFEGHRWFDLVRTGKAVQVMNAQVGGNGQNLNYNVQPFETLKPVPQNQIDLNPRLDQNPGY